MAKKKKTKTNKTEIERIIDAEREGEEKGEIETEDKNEGMEEIGVMKR